MPRISMLIMQRLNNLLPLRFPIDHAPQRHVLYTAPKQFSFLNAVFQCFLSEPRELIFRYNLWSAQRSEIISDLQIEIGIY